MDETLTRRLQQLEIKVENQSEMQASSQSRINDLEDKLAKSKIRYVKFKHMEQEVQSLKGELRNLTQKLAKQEKQIQIANEKSGKLEKLQIILNSLLLHGKQLNRRDMPDELKSKLNDVAQRIGDVEKNCAKNFSEVVSLKTKISVIETDSRSDHSSLKRNLGEVKGSYENDLKAMKQEVDSLKSKISAVETDPGSVHFSVGRNPGEVKGRYENDLEVVKQEVDSLKTKMSAIENDPGSVHFSLKRNLGEVKGRYENDLKAMKQETDFLKLRISAIENVIGRSDSPLNRNVEENAVRFGNPFMPPNEEAAASGNLLSTSNRHSDTVTESIFHVQTEQNQNLSDDASTLLGDYKELLVNGAFFDTQVGLYLVPVDGLYLFNVNVGQSGYGKISMTVGPVDGTQYCVAVPYVRSGWFHSTRDFRSGSIVLHLTQGQQVGVFAQRIKGEATVECCAFAGCLISPST